MTISEIRKIRSELKAFNEVLRDAEQRIKVEHNPKYNRSISGTKESSALKSAYKVMKYKIDKLL